MPNNISNPRGTADILPNEIPTWRFLEERAREIFQNYGYCEIRTPIFEDVGLFKRSLGETTEVVNKQLLEVRSQRADAEDASFALRPEGTAPVVRAYNQNGLERSEGLSKFFYIAPMFRGERPQKGRLRQFHQIGAEAIGYQGDNPLLDVEMIALAAGLLKAFGVDGFKLRINSLGTAEDKAGFAEWLRKQLKGKIDHLSDDCKSQYERNVFRLLDSKHKDCQAVVQSLNIGTAHLSEKGLQYFETVKKGLDKLGIAYEVSNQLVRGLDYYTHTVFEISCEGLGAQDALGAGGRYNGLIEQLGGGDKRMDKPVAGIGFALGIERILLALEAQGKTPGVRGALDVFIVSGNEALEEQAFVLLNKLRQAGISTDMDFGKRNLKKQFEVANKLGAKFVAVLGEKEVGNGQVALKDMGSGVQADIQIGNVVIEIKNRVGNWEARAEQIINKLSKS
jgi:histidyl-tRNA synthetase